MGKDNKERKDSISIGRQTLRRKPPEQGSGRNEDEHQIFDLDEADQSALGGHSLQAHRRVHDDEEVSWRLRALAPDGEQFVASGETPEDAGALLLSRLEARIAELTALRAGLIAQGFAPGGSAGGGQQAGSKR